MSGINVLNSIPVMRNPSYFNILFIISIICIILGGVFLLLSLYLNFWEIPNFVISCVLIISSVIIAFYTKCNANTVQTGRYQYEVTIDDNVKFKDVIDKYNIIEQHGKIWILEDK